MKTIPIFIFYIYNAKVDNVAIVQTDTKKHMLQLFDEYTPKPNEVASTVVFQIPSDVPFTPIIMNAIRQMILDKERKRLKLRLQLAQQLN